MNYIKQLQTDRKQHATEARGLEMALTDILTLLQSPKFVTGDSTERKDWISTGDVMRLIQPLRNSASYLATDLEK